jgi:hypothetical protein
MTPRVIKSKVIRTKSLKKYRINQSSKDTKKQNTHLSITLRDPQEIPISKYRDPDNILHIDLYPKVKSSIEQIENKDGILEQKGNQEESIDLGENMKDKLVYEKRNEEDFIRNEMLDNEFKNKEKKQKVEKVVPDVESDNKVIRDDKNKKVTRTQTYRKKINEGFKVLFI